MIRLILTLAFVALVVSSPSSAWAQATIDSLSLDTATCGPGVAPGGFDGRVAATITIDDCTAADVVSRVSPSSSASNQCVTKGVGTHELLLQYLSWEEAPHSTAVATVALQDGFNGPVLDVKSVAFNCTTGGASPCPPAPRAGCRGAGSSKLTSRVVSSFGWIWAKGEATTEADFGDPTLGTAYALCVYHDGEIRGASDFPADATAWKAINGGFKRKDKFFTYYGTKVGSESVKLKAGEDGKAKIVVRQKVFAAPSMPYPFEPPVTVQLVNLDSDLCFESVFDADDIKTNKTLNPDNPYFSSDGSFRGVAKQ